MGRPKLTKEKVNKILSSRDDGVILIGDYVDSRTKSLFLDPEYGEWWATPGNIIYGNQHKLRVYASKKLSESELIKRLDQDGRGIKYIRGFNGMEKKCLFSCPTYGDFWANPSNVIRNGSGHPDGAKEKTKQTCISRYGVEHPFQNPEIALKSAKSNNNIAIMFHWQDNSELVCQGSYEKRAVDYMNKNRIEFLWQPRVFALSNGQTYRPDMFLKKENMWVEIKGYMRQDAMLKCELFSKDHPNYEIWDTKILRSKGII